MAWYWIVLDDHLPHYHRLHGSIGGPFPNAAKCHKIAPCVHVFFIGPQWLPHVEITGVASAMEIRLHEPTGKHHHRKVVGIVLQKLIVIPK